MIKTVSGKQLFASAWRSGKTDCCFNVSAANQRNGKVSESSNAGQSKTRKRPAIKAAPRLTTSKVKSTIHLSVEASQRLDIHATMMGLDRSALVEKLINDQLRRYVVSDRGGPDGIAGSEVA